MSGKAAKIVLSEKQEGILQQIRSSTTAPQRLVQRVGIILLAFAGSLNVDIARELGFGRRNGFVVIAVSGYALAPDFGFLF